MSLHDVLRQCDGRYPTAEERERALTFARSLPQRVRASEEVEAHEDAAVEAAVTALSERYPRFGRVHPQAWERLTHDLRLILRADVRALIADDPSGLDAQALCYLRSMWAAYHVTPAFAREACELLADQLRTVLSAESLSALEPFLSRNLHVLGGVPEPAVAAV